MRTTNLNRNQAQAILAGWQDVMGTLASTVEDWSRARKWEVEWSSAEVDEELLGTYKISVLTIETEKGRLLLEPIARMVVGAEGRVDLYAWPTLFRVMLLYTADRTWTVRTDSGIDWPQPWGMETFYALAAALLRRP